MILKHITTSSARFNWSTYLANLNIKTIRAYAAGEIIDVILGGIMNNKHLTDKFRLLFKVSMRTCAGLFLSSASNTTILKAPLTRWKRGMSCAAKFLTLL